MKYIFWLLIIYLLLVGLEQPSSDRYIIYSKSKAIKISHIETTDEDNLVRYFDMNHDSHFARTNTIDSVVVLKESKWTRGSESPYIKYIHHEIH